MAESPERPFVFFDITIDGAPAGRIIFTLFSDLVPKTAENFRMSPTSRIPSTSFILNQAHYVPEKRELESPVNHCHSRDLASIGSSKGEMNFYSMCSDGVTKSPGLCARAATSPLVMALAENPSMAKSLRMKPSQSTTQSHSCCRWCAAL